jgi:DNA-directed RNA polymerase specialized sigma54-like protein
MSEKKKKAKVVPKADEEALGAEGLDEEDLDDDWENEEVDEETLEKLDKVIADLEKAGVRLLNKDEIVALGLDRYGPASKEAKELREKYLKGLWEQRVKDRKNKND